MRSGEGGEGTGRGRAAGGEGCGQGSGREQGEGERHERKEVEKGWEKGGGVGGGAMVGRPRDVGGGGRKKETMRGRRAAQIGKERAGEDPRVVSHNGKS